MAEAEGKPRGFIIAGRGGSETFHPVPPVEETGGSTKKPFEESPIAGDEGVISGIQTDVLRRQFGMLHEALAANPKQLSIAELRAESAAIRKGAQEGKYSRSEADPLWKSISDYANKLEEEERKKDGSGATTAFAAAAGTAAAEEIGERVGDAIGDRIRGDRTDQRRDSKEGQAVRNDQGQAEDSEAEPVETFGSIQKRIDKLAEKIWLNDPDNKFQDKDDEELNDLIAKRDEFYERAERLNLLDNLREGVINVARGSAWDDVKQDILDARGRLSKTFYDEADEHATEFEGFPEAVLKGVANEVSWQGFLRMRNADGTWDPDFLKRNGKTREDMRRLEFMTQFTSFVGFANEVPGFVGQKERRARAAQPGADDAYQSLNQPTNQMDQLIAEMRAGRQLNEAQLQMYQQQSEGMAEAFRGTSPDKEVANWVDIEYRMEFWTRFEPRSWPKFYENATPPERRLLDSRWKLARAAFFKKNTSSFPEKQIENSDLMQMTKEDLKALYEINGARQMMEGYVDFITGGLSFNRNSGEIGISTDIDEDDEDADWITIWDCQDEIEFERMRVALREYVLGGDGAFAAAAVGEFGRITGAAGGLDNGRRELAVRTMGKVADAVAWNFLWVTNVIESLDSRYGPEGKSGDRHGNLPGALVSDDIRAMLHPQEKWEDKWWKNQEWGAFGKWGKTQITEIRGSRALLNAAGDEERPYIRGAKTVGDYWRVVNTGEGRTLLVPECYPTKSLGSFIEAISIKQGDGSYKSLLQYLKNGDVIPWENFDADPWVPYLAIWFNKANKLSEYYAGKIPFEYPKPGSAVAWAGPLNDIWVRLGFPRQLEESVRRPGDNMGNEAVRKQVQRKAANLHHNLKVWALYASMGGIKDPEKKFPTFNMGALDSYTVVEGLRDQRVGYLKRGFLGGENLDFLPVT